MTESVGERLKKIRLEKGLTLEEVHKRTKIHLSILKTIEENSPINLSPVYIKGFLKIYCKFLGLDPKDFIPDYKGPSIPVKYVSEAEQKTVSFLKNISIKLSTFRPKLNLKIVSSIVLIVIFFVGLFHLGKTISFKRTQRNRSAIVSPSKEENKVEATKSQKTQIPSTLRLSIRSKEDCWINVRADGRVVFQSILKKGRAETWQAKEKIELSLGNAQAVILEVNGKIISNLGRRGQVLKNILITKEGLSIPR